MTTSTTTHPPRRVLRNRAAADYLGVSESTLPKWRMRGDGPAYRKLGRVVVYDLADLDAFLDFCRCQSTSELEGRRLNRLGAVRGDSFVITPDHDARATNSGRPNSRKRHGKTAVPNPSDLPA